MKLNKWFYGVVAMVMMASCSDNLSNGSNSSEVGGNGASSGDVSYLGVNLELPQERATRGENDVFDDGLEKEYEVDHAALLLFQGDNEADAKFVGAYKLDTDQAFDQPNGDQVTVSFQKSIKVLEKPNSSNGQLWGLAIINYSTNIFSIKADPDNTQEYGDLTVKIADNSEGVDLVRISESNATAPATTFSTFRGYLTTSPFIRQEGGCFFMTNAPLSNKKGENVKPSAASIQTLAKLADNFKKTSTEAIQNPAGCIFVERAVAKITCSNFPASVKIPHTAVTIGDNGAPTYTPSDYTLYIQNVEWLIDNEEEKSYIVRNAQGTTGDDSWKFWEYENNGLYRFIGGKGMNDTAYDNNAVHQEGATTWYRTYWCIDPNYSSDKTFINQANKDNPAYVALQRSTVGENSKYISTSALYPHENTFDVEHQTYKNTTRVVFKVKYSTSQNDKGVQLYAVRGERKIMYLEDDAKNLLKRSVLGSIMLHDLILKYKKDGTVDYTDESFEFRFGLAATSDDELGIVKDDYIITELTFKENFITEKFKSPLSDEDKEYIKSELANVVKSANASNHLIQFTDNTCYYAVYLQHFGDDYCKLPEGWIGNEVSTVYGKQEESAQKYLGRYGLVRNNWYDLSVNNILRLGSATVPNGNVTTSDDNKTEEWFLSARVHVLSWAKRTQNVTFE